MTAWIDQALYDTFRQNMPIVCVDVAICRDGAVLLVRRKDAPAQGQWWLPGGRVLKGERLHETAQRKARDEVGLECRVGPLIHADETIFTEGPHGISVHTVNLCYRLSPLDPAARVQLDGHHSDWKWVTTSAGELHSYVEACLRAAGLPGPT